MKSDDFLDIISTAKMFIYTALILLAVYSLTYFAFQKTSIQPLEEASNGLMQQVLKMKE